MEISVVDKNGVEDEPVRKESEIPSSSLNSCEKNPNRSDHDKSLSTSDEGDNGSLKKKNISGTKKGRKGSKKKPSTKASSHRKQLTHHNSKSDALLGRSHHSALNRVIKTRTRMETRRQSMGSIYKDSATFHIKNGEDATDDDSDSNPSEISDCEDSDIDSVQSQSQTISTREKSSSNRSFDTLKSQKNRSQTSSTNSLRSLSTHNNRNRPSSSSSLLSTAKSLNLSSHSRSSTNGGGVDTRNASFGSNDFNSDPKDATTVKHPLDGVPSVIENVTKDIEISAESSPPIDKNSSCSKDISRSQTRTLEGRNGNGVLDSKQRKSRHPQLAQTDELGCGSNHYKLDGIYFNQRPESKNQATKSNSLNVEDEEIQVLTKRSPSDSNHHENRKRTSSKPRLRSRRRSSIGAGEDQLSRVRSRSREHPSTRKEFSRIRSASSEKRAKGGTSANLTSPKSQEVATNLFKSDASASNEDAIPGKIVDLKAPLEPERTACENRLSTNSSSKVEEKTSPSATENTTFEIQHSFNGLIKDKPENSTNTENKNVNTTSQATEKRQRRRSSIGRTMRKDRVSTPSRQVGKKVSSSDTAALAENQLVSEAEIMNALSECQPSSDAKASVTNTAGNENKQIDPQPRELERKQRRRNSMGKTMRKDKVSTPSQVAEKETFDSNIPKQQAFTHIATKNSDQKSKTEAEKETSDDLCSFNASIKEVTAEESSANNDRQSKALERKQRRRSSMGRTMRKDRVSAPAQVAEKELHLSNLLPLQQDPSIISNIVDQKLKTETENKTSNERCLSNTGNDNEESLANLEYEVIKIDLPSKDLERKQHRRSSIGRTMRKDRVAVPSQVAEKELHSSNIPRQQEDPNIISKNRDQKFKAEMENKSSDEQCLSNTLINDDETEESLANMEYESIKIGLPSKDLDMKQRRRSSMGRTTRNNRVSTSQEGEEKLFQSTVVPLNEDQVVVGKIIILEPENVTSNNRDLCNSPNKHASAEESIAKLENGTMKLNSKSEAFDKKQRRRSSSGKPTRKDRNTPRIAGKSGHKLSRKSTREKKRRDACKKQDSAEDFTSEEFASEEFASEFASEEFFSEFVAENDVANEYLKNNSTELAKNRSTTRKEKTSTRKKIEKEKRGRRKDLSPNETNRECNHNKENDCDLKVNTESTESSAEDDEFSERSKRKVAAPSLSDLFSSNDHDAREAKDVIGSLTPSLCSSESEEKDDEEADEDNYLQLTFVAESGVGTDNLFALMDEQLNRSFNQSFSNDMDASNTDSADRNTSIRSFVSFTNEIELRVSTTSYSLSRNVQDGDDPASETFHCNHSIFVNASGEEISTQMKKASTPTPRRKKLTSPSFGLSRSLHAAVPFGDAGFVNGIGEESNKIPKRGMLRKMRKGITEGSKLTFQKAATTRNLLGQATTKVLSRNKEEGRGLLSEDSD